MHRGKPWKQQEQKWLGRSLWGSWGEQVHKTPLAGRRSPPGPHSGPATQGKRAHGGEPQPGCQVHLSVSLSMVPSLCSLQQRESWRRPCEPCFREKTGSTMPLETGHWGVSGAAAGPQLAGIPKGWVYTPTLGTLILVLAPQ